MSPSFHIVRAHLNLQFSGNALLDGALSKRHNAFSMMLPAISGVGYFDRLDVNIRSDLEGWSFNPDGSRFQLQSYLYFV